MSELSIPFFQPELVWFLLDGYALTVGDIGQFHSLLPVVVQFVKIDGQIQDSERVGLHSMRHGIAFLANSRNLPPLACGILDNWFHFDLYPSKAGVIPRGERSKLRRELLMQD